MKKRPTETKGKKQNQNPKNTLSYLPFPSDLRFVIFLFAFHQLVAFKSVGKIFNHFCELFQLVSDSFFKEGGHTWKPLSLFSHNIRF
jgi:hypothetical protein